MMLVASNGKKMNKKLI